MSQAQFWLYSEGDDKYVTQQQQEEKKKKLLTLLKEVIQQLIAEAVDHKEQISIQNPAAFKLCHLIELILSNGLRDKSGEQPTFWKLIDSPKYVKELEIPEADLKRLDMLKCRIWIRYAINKKRIGTYISEAINNAPAITQCYHEWALLRVLDQATVAVHLLLSLETMDFRLSLHNIEAHPDEELLELKKRPLTRSSTVKKKRSKLVSIESADPDSPRSERSGFSELESRVSDAVSDVSGAESARNGEEVALLTAELESLRAQHRALVELRDRERGDDATLQARASEVESRANEVESRARELTEQSAVLTRREEELTQTMTGVTQRTAALALREEQLTQRESEAAQRGEDLTRRETDITQRGEDLTRRERDLALRGDDLALRELEVARKLDDISRREQELARRDDEVTQRQAEIARREDDVTAAQTQLALLQRDVTQRTAELQREHVTLTEQRDQWAEQHGALDRALTARETELSDRSRTLEARDTEQQQRASALDAREDELTRARTELDRALQQLSDAQSALTRDQRAVESRAQELKLREDELTRVTLEQVHASDSEGRATAHIAELSTRLALASEQLAADRRDFEAQLTRARETADRALQEARERAQNEAALTVRAEKSARECDEVRAALGTQETQCSDALQQLTALRREHETVAEQCKTTEATRLALVAELTRVTEECARQDRELETVRHELTEARTHEHEAVDSQAAQITHLAAQLQRGTEASAALSTERDAALTRVTELQQSFDHVSHQLQQMTLELTRVTEQHAAELTTMRTERDQAQHEHAAALERAQHLDHVVHELRAEIDQLRAQLASDQRDGTAAHELEVLREQNALLQGRVTLLVRADEELQRAQQALDQHAAQARADGAQILALQDEVTQLRAQLSDGDQQVLDETAADEKDRAISADSSLSQTPLDQSPLSLSASLSQGQNTPPTDAFDSPLASRTLVQPVPSKVDKVASNSLVLYDDYTADTTPRTLSYRRESDSEESDADIILAPSDINVKQLIKRKEDSDPREVTERLKTMNTQRVQWQPPKKQMHYYPHEKVAKSVVLAQQGYLCAGCGKQLLLRTGDVAKTVRYCEYSGRYFCSTCHKNDKYCVPARIVFEWDFKSYPVAQFYKQFLKEIKHEPLFDIQALNPQLYAQVAEFKYIRVARRQLFYLKDFVFTCRDKDKLLDSQISARIHLVDSRYYSLQDLLDIQSGKLHQDLKAVLLKWVAHVARCDLCKVKGSYCEFCRSTEILYPFQLRSVVVCRHCKALAHRTCYREDQCPKCARSRLRLLRAY